MPFPLTLLDPRVDMLLGGGWTDVTHCTRLQDRIVITRGLADESPQQTPSSCKFWLNNQTGIFSPKNPLGPYYGQLTPNIPVRVHVRMMRDEFNRAVSNGWGVATSGETWTIGVGVGGTVQNSDWNVAGAAATHSVPTTLAYRLSYLAGALYRDVDVTVPVRVLPNVSVTGGAIEPANVLVRGVSTTDYLMVRATIEPDQTVRVALMHHSGTIYASAVTVAGLTHVGDQWLMVRAQIEGQSFRAKVWDSAGLEPYAWHVSAQLPDTVAPVAGWVGVRSGVGSGNTNTKPILFSYGPFEVRSMRFAGEIAAARQRVDKNSQAYIDVTANGPLRRLGQGQNPLNSALYRGITRLAPSLRAYWPAEDDAGSTSIASALGHASMFVTGGTPGYASYSDIPASAPLPTLNGSAWFVHLEPYASTGKIQLRWVMHIPAAGALDGREIIGVQGTGTAQSWHVVYGTGGTLAVRAFSNTIPQVLLHDSGPQGFNVNGKNVLCSLELQEVGANAQYTISVLEVGQGTGGFTTNTVTGRTVGQATDVAVSWRRELTDVALGHISVQSETTSLFDLANQLNAFAGETALDRLVRLCAEEAVPFSRIDVPGPSALMGPQRPGQLVDLLQECATADLGVPYEMRGTSSLAYRTIGTLYNQTAVTIDYGQLAPPLHPTVDDQQTRNDITVKRVGGSSYRSTVTTGPRSIQPPPDGVGRYDDEVTVNLAADGQLPDQGNWRTTLGTVDEPRLPAIRVILGSSEVAATPQLAVSMLDLNVGDRLIVENATPIHVYDDISLIARGLTETMRTFECTIDINCVPESPYSVVRLDTPGHKLNSDATTLTSGINDSAASFQVSISDGVLWTTDAAQMPIRMEIDGEEISVGAISGTSSPQTFSSVTRHVNGVQKSHSAGAKVRLARRAPLGL